MPIPAQLSQALHTRQIQRLLDDTDEVLAQARMQQSIAALSQGREINVEPRRQLDESRRRLRADRSLF